MDTAGGAERSIDGIGKYIGRRDGRHERAAVSGDEIRGHNSGDSADIVCISFYTKALCKRNNARISKGLKINYLQRCP
jgi:hypothetical protein